MPPKVGLDVGVDLRRPCPLAEVPTDEEAKNNGFDTAQEWWTYSTGGALLTPGQAMTNYGNCRDATEPSKEDQEHHSMGEVWVGYKSGVEGKFADDSNSEHVDQLTG